VRALCFPALAALLASTGGFVPPGLWIGQGLASGLRPAHSGIFPWQLGLLLFAFSVALGLRALDRRVRAQPEALAGEARLRRVAFGLGLWIALGIVAVNAAVGPLASGASDADQFQVAIGWLVRTIVLWLPLGSAAGAFLARRGRLGGSSRSVRWGLAALGLAAVGLDLGLVLRSLAP